MSKGRPRKRRVHGPFESKHSVTSVLFLHSDHILATSGAPPDPAQKPSSRALLQALLVAPAHPNFPLETTLGACVLNTHKDVFFCAVSSDL